MLKIFTLACCLLCCIVLPVNAQNWAPFTPGETHHFHSPGSNFPDRSVRIDSIVGNSTDSVWHFNRLWEQVAWDTALYNQPLFCGRSLRVKAGGLYQLFDPTNMAIYAEANPGATWLLDSVQNLTGTVSMVWADSVLGEPDSLKSILLTGGDSIVLSRAHGCLHWPVALGGREYGLAGIQERHLGDSLPGFDGFFQYKAGDEYYWISEYYQGDVPPFFTAYDWETKMVIDSVRRDGAGLHVAYSVVQRTYWQNNMNAGYGSTYTDTLLLRDSLGALVNRVHEEPIRFELLMRAYDFERQWANAGPAAYDPQWMFGGEHWTAAHYRRNLDTTVLQIGLDVGAETYVYAPVGPSTLSFSPEGFQQRVEITEHLGVTHVSWWDFETMGSYRLVGHIIDGDTVGTIWTDSVLLGRVVAMPAVHWQVSPNPANEVLRVTVESNEPAELRILSLSGQLLKTQPIEHGQASLDVSELPVGLYLAGLVAGGQESYRKVAVAR